MKAQELMPEGATMMNATQDPRHEAVMFFDQEAVAREMHAREFEAILDGVVGLPDLANQTVRAAYLRIDARLKIRECVLFLVSFDRTGKADSRWNIPLEHLAAQAGRGPDLGAGPIRLACRSQCPVSWHSESLWDAREGSTGHPLAKLRRAVNENRLRFPVSAAVPPTLSDAVPTASGKSIRDVIISLRREHAADRDRLQAAHRAELERLRTAHAGELQTVRQQIESLKLEWQSQAERLVENRVAEETQRLQEAIRLRDQELRHRYDMARQMREELFRLRQSTGGSTDATWSLAMAERADTTH